MKVMIAEFMDKGVQTTKFSYLVLTNPGHFLILELGDYRGITADTAVIPLSHYLAAP